MTALMKRLVLAILQAAVPGLSTVASVLPLLKKGVSWLASDVWRIALLAAILAFGVQTVRIEGLHLGFKVGPVSLQLVSITGLKQRAQTAEGALQLVKSAQVQAGAAQAAANHEPAAKSAAIAKASDDKTSEYLANVAIAATRHRQTVHAGGTRTVPVPHDAGGGLCSGAGHSPGSNAAVPGADRIAQGDDDTPGSSGMVSVARDDWNKVTREAALRAQLYEAGQAMIAAGIAVEASDPPATVPDPPDAVSTKP